MLYGIEVIDIKLYVHIINSMALILLISVTLISFKYISQFLVFKLDWTRLEDGGGGGHSCQVRERKMRESELQLPQF